MRLLTVTVLHAPPPLPPQVGKTTLIKGLIKHYTRQDVREIKGPITLIAGKARRWAQPGAAPPRVPPPALGGAQPALHASCGSPPGGPGSVLLCALMPLGPPLLVPPPAPLHPPTPTAAYPPATQADVHRVPSGPQRDD